MTGKQTEGQLTLDAPEPSQRERRVLASLGHPEYASFLAVESNLSGDEVAPSIDLDLVTNEVGHALAAAVETDRALRRAAEAILNRTAMPARAAGLRLSALMLVTPETPRLQLSLPTSGGVFSALKARPLTLLAVAAACQGADWLHVSTLPAANADGRHAGDDVGDASALLSESLNLDGLRTRAQLRRPGRSSHPFALRIRLSAPGHPSVLVQATELQERPGK